MLSTLNYKQIAALGDSKRKPEYHYIAERKENDIGNNSVLSKSDVLPFVLKGNEISLSEAPTESTLPILPIFITPSEQSSIAIMHPENSKSIEPCSNSYPATCESNASVTNNIEVASCAAGSRGKDFCSCYNCILPEEAYRDLIVSPEHVCMNETSDISDTLNFDSLMDQEKTKLKNNAVQSNEICAYSGYFKVKCDLKILYLYPAIIFI